MVDLFVILFLITVVATVVFLFKPSLTQFNNRPALSRITISISGTILSLICLFIIGTLSPTPPKSATDDKGSEHSTPNHVEKSEAKKDNNIQEKSEPEKSDIEDNKPPFELTNDPKQNVVNAQAHYEKLAEEDRPHFEWPRIDYTKPVTKVNLKNDQAIVKAVGKAVADQEKSTNENGEPMTSYWFDKQPASGLQIDLSREFIDVAWQFNDKDQDKATAIFNDGQRITRALLGGKVGSELYEKMAKGLKFEELQLDDGTVIKNARCGSSMCRYQILR